MWADSFSEPPLESRIVLSRAGRTSGLHALTGILVLLFSMLTSVAQATPARTIDTATPLPSVRIDDVTRFFAVYDQSHGKPSAAELQTGYINPGSTGLHEFITARIGSAQALAKAITKSPQDYRNARHCMRALPAVRERLRRVFAKLARIDPHATFPPVTIVIGRNNTGGTTTAEGVTIGLEVICRANWLDPNIVERLVHLIAHEYVHVQQPAAQVAPPDNATLLFQSLVEGGAEFIGELISGEVTNSHLKQWALGKRCRIERQFQAHAMGTETSGWLYNGPGTPEKPGDLGYWVGYRIVRAYYIHANNKQRAIQAILHVNNANAADFLKHSGWRAEDDCKGAQQIIPADRHPATRAVGG